MFLLAHTTHFFINHENKLVHAGSSLQRSYTWNQKINEQSINACQFCTWFMICTRLTLKHLPNIIYQLPNVRDVLQGQWTLWICSVDTQNSIFCFTIFHRTEIVDLNRIRMRILSGVGVSSISDFSLNRDFYLLKNEKIILLKMSWSIPCYYLFIFWSR